MGVAGFRGSQWTGILLSASLLTTWNLPAAAQSTQPTSLSFYLTQRETASLLTTWNLPAAAQSTQPTSVSFYLTQKETASLAKPTLSVNPDTVTEQKDMATFYCDTAVENATIRWISNNLYLVLNERMQLSKDHKTLRILIVQREDFGTYQCEVQLGLEAKSSNEVTLCVNYGPDPVAIKLDSGVASGDVVELMEGSNVTFQVETRSQPAPSYTWYLPTDSIYPTTETFTINAVSREHEGMYRCLVVNNVTQLSQLGVVQVRVLDPQSSSLSSGVIAGIVIVIVMAMAVVAGLGCFLYRRRRTRRRSANDVMPEATQPTSMNECRRDPRPNLGYDNPRPVYDNVPEPQRWIRDTKMPPPVLPEQLYESKPPSAAPEGSRKPLSQVPKQPLMPPVSPQRNMESDYETLMNPDPDTYCTIKPSI
ncbi:carcinoembryonic antigen-related cell adhesion molecule 20 [Nannospalax galili]|uniref:carcinoembryonic antigen-related cell adhesion molecule 20 n=1 Tax=Nannospalax galili TaxID=1026970 RepID=UPI0004ED293D|nr:carcinoembryonic antigen-related cell adhesion molecule 20 [Nannospalax galili]